MAIQATHFRTSTPVMMASHPYGGAAHSTTQGVPLGRVVGRWTPFCFDPMLEKKLGIISSTTGMFLGDKGMGKSLGMKVMAWRLCMVGAGYKVMRVAINDHKAEGQASEYTELGKAFGCETFNIATRSVNPFESMLGLGDLNALEMGTMLTEHVFKQPLIDSDFEALKAAVYVMRTFPENMWSIQTLAKMASSLTNEYIDEYYLHMTDRMRGQLLARMGRVASGVVQEEAYRQDVDRIFNGNDNISYDEIIRGGERIANLLSTLLEGKYGQMLGGMDSLHYMLTRRAIIKDWRGVASKDAVSLMRAIDHRVQINAIEQGLDDLVPNIELDDEDHQSMENETYAQSKMLQSKIIRSAKKINISGSHRTDDYRKGGRGSKLWGYGESILDDMGFWFVGRQPNKPAVLDELQDRLNLSNAMRNRLPTLRPFEFITKIGEEEPVRRIRFTPTPFELAFSLTDSANDEMTTRPGLNPREYEKVATATGFNLKE